MGKISMILLGLVVLYLMTEHIVHVLGVLPYLLVLSCVFMHLFMHGGHGGHSGHNQP